AACTQVHRAYLQCARELRDDFGPQVRLGEGERDSLTVLQASDYQRFGGQLRRALVAGAPRELVDDIVERYRGLPPERWTDPDRWLAAHDVIDVADVSLVAVPTPGHTSGHLAFHDRTNGLLFTGDAVLPHITPSAG